MKTSTIAWHLARDNQEKLAKFCSKNCIEQHPSSDKYIVDDGTYWQQTYHFDNGGFIRAELRAGDTKSYSIVDHFQVVDYNLGAI